MPTSHLGINPCFHAEGLKCAASAMVSRATCQVFRASTFGLRAGRSKLALRASGSGQKGGLSDPSAQRKRSLQAVASGLFFIHYPASLELGPFDTLQELSTSARDPPAGMTEQKAALRASLGTIQNLRLENANSGEAVCSCSAARRRRVCRSRHTRGGLPSNISSTLFLWAAVFFVYEEQA